LAKVDSIYSQSSASTPQCSPRRFCNFCHVLELAQSTGLLANSIAMLGSSEENTGLARVLARLAEVEEHCDNVHVDQSDVDFFVFAKLIHEYIGLVQAVKVGSETV